MLVPRSRIPFHEVVHHTINHYISNFENFLRMRHTKINSIMFDRTPSDEVKQIRLFIKSCFIISMAAFLDSKLAQLTDIPLVIRAIFALSLIRLYLSSLMIQTIFAMMFVTMLSDAQVILFYTFYIRQI